MLAEVALSLQVQAGLIHAMILLMDKILHDPKDPKLWELWYFSL